MMMTEHANIRCQQRGIKPQLLEIIMQFGEKSIMPGGASGYFLKKKSINRMTCEYRECNKKMVQMLDRLKGVQVVESQDGMIITAYHRR